MDSRSSYVKQPAFYLHSTSNWSGYGVRFGYLRENILRPDFIPLAWSRAFLPKRKGKTTDLII